MMDVNYLGSVYVTRAVIPSMKARRSGRVVFISSQAGQLGLFGYTGYSASKFALRGLAEALQMEVSDNRFCCYLRDQFSMLVLRLGQFQQLDDCRVTYNMAIEP